jgi:type II secretory pathway component PulM
MRSPFTPLRYGLAALAFCLVATLNSGGYRFGVGDQAFHLPAIERHLAPELFPRDRVVIEAQDGLTLVNRVAALVVSRTGTTVAQLFAGAYLLTLVLLLAASLSVARQLGLSPWAQVALIAAMTLRHRVGLTGVNTLESYMQPRMLAFGIGMAAVSTYLRSRIWLAIGLVALAAIVHPTTAFWFAVWLGVAIYVSDPRWRKLLASAAAVAAVGMVWTVGWGPLAERTVRMDAEWLAVLAAKDYLFANAWPASMWLIAGLYVAVVLAVFLIRRSAGQLHPRETGLVMGALVLVGIFLATLPLVARGMALAVQLQISRLFWMLDVLGTIYLVWAVADGPGLRTSSTSRGTTSHRRAMVVAIIMVCAAIGRGAYVMWIEHPGRPVLELSLPHTDWQDAMDWLKATPTTTHVLADPGHAWRYGTSVRVAASRDVYLEEVKDAALAMYSRPIAMRVAERIRALGSFDALTPQRARELARRFEIDYLVCERTLDLPVAYRNARFFVYRVR